MRLRLIAFPLLHRLHLKHICQPACRKPLCLPAVLVYACIGEEPGQRNAAAFRLDSAAGQAGYFIVGELELMT